MFHQALKRLFLVLFPVILFVTALYLSYIQPPQQGSKSQQISNKNCPFSLGVSFFSQKEDFQKNKLKTYILSEFGFLKKMQNLKNYFRTENVSQKQIFFVFPLTLTKEEEWIVSQKTLFILPTGERKQISHFTYSEINHFHKDLYWFENFETFSEDSHLRKSLALQRTAKPVGDENSNLINIKQEYKALKLNVILSSLPKRSNFLFYLLGSDRKKIIKNLDKIQNKTQGRLYLSSPNEKLLKDLLLYQSCLRRTSSSEDFHPRGQDCLAGISNKIGIFQTNLNPALKENTKILHSFKTLIRLKMLSIFPQPFKKIQGEGIIVPASVPPSQEILHFLKQEDKLLFFKKDPPYRAQDKYWIKHSQALISSQAKLAISSIKEKKTCLIKK